VKPPLDGLVVADFSRVLAGPLVTMLLGDLGADVVKVERPGAGDDTRAWGPPWHDGESTYFLGLNRNKRSLLLDLTSPDDRTLAVRLASRADVLVENFKPGTAERFGLGYDELAAHNPRLVYASITGFGPQPGGADLPGYDLLVQAASGLMSVTGEAEGRPLKVGVALVDVVTGLYTTIGVLAALEARHATGRGQRVDVSLLAAALAALVNQASAHVVAGAVPRRAGNRHPSIAPYETFDAADRPFVLACGNDAQFAKVADAVGRPELAADERFATNAARVANVGELSTVLGACFATGPAAEWIERLTAAGVPAGPINDLAEAFAMARAVGLDAIWPGPVPTVAHPIALSATPAAPRLPPPRLGAHDAELRAWLSARTPGDPR
jgi:crotonobetainyl-CoA:carnitine CoA-transferase CaiB-like acyl-CoA transferase